MGEEPDAPRITGTSRKANRGRLPICVRGHEGGLAAAPRSVGKSPVSALGGVGRRLH